MREVAKLFFGIFVSMVPAIAMASRNGAKDKPHRLRLRYQGQELVMTDGRMSVTLGRAEENDMVIKGNLISRLHARIEFSRNKFMLIDQSTNGTFVLNHGVEESFVRRDSLQLKGEGMIGLGKTPDVDSPQTLRFVCEEA